MPSKRRIIRSSTRQMQTIVILFLLMTLFLVMTAELVVNNLGLARQPKYYDGEPLAFGPLISRTCSNQLNVVRILLILRVHINHSGTRMNVRKKIESSPECKVKVLFLYGRFPNDEDHKVVSSEKQTHGDILQLEYIEDHYLKGQAAVDAVKPFLTKDPCVVHQQVAFGSFVMETATRHHGLQDGKMPSVNKTWVDMCLKFTQYRRTNIQFFAHYFPRRLLPDISKDVHRQLSQSSVFEYQESAIEPFNHRYLIAPKNDKPSGTTISEQLSVIIAVHSDTLNFENRITIRSTWGNLKDLARNQMRLVFVMGRKARMTSRALNKLKLEALTYQDIVQVDFLDSYKNMAVKQLSLLRYLTETCQQTRYSYVFKTDDDMVLHLPSIADYVASMPLQGTSTRRSFFCINMMEVAYVLRGNDKWNVSLTDYPDTMYPAYCSGGGYLISKDLVSILYNASRHVKAFWVDDAFVSGLLPLAVGDVTLHQISKQRIFQLEELVKKPDILLAQQLVFHVEQEMLFFNIYWRKFRHLKQKNRLRIA